MLTQPEILAGTALWQLGGNSCAEEPPIGVSMVGSGGLLSPLFSPGTDPAQQAVGRVVLQVTRLSCAIPGWTRQVLWKV